MKEKAGLWLLELLYAVRVQWDKLKYRIYHIVFEKEQGRWRFKLIKHEKYLTEVDEQLIKLKRDCDSEEYLVESMKLARECRCVIFSSSDGVHKLWWLFGLRSIEMNVLMTPMTKLKKYKYPILGVLSELGFAKNTGNKTFKFGYAFEPEDEEWLLKAFFGTDLNKATEAALKIFRDVYKVDLSSVVVEVG